MKGLECSFDLLIMQLCINYGYFDALFRSATARILSSFLIGHLA